MKETVFTKIARREVPAYFIDENEEFMAILDAFPSSYAQTLVIPKEWHDSYIFNNDDEFLARFYLYIKKIAKLLDEKLGSERCLLFFEGYGVDHLHAKIYPSFQTETGFEEFNPRNRIDFNHEVAKDILRKLGK